MKFISIFTNKLESNLWAVKYQGMRKNVYSMLMEDIWNNVVYLTDFIEENIEHLEHPFWEGLTIDQAIEQISEEKFSLDYELYAIETQKAGYESYTMQDIFKKLHRNIYSINTDKESHRKGKADNKKPILRLYGIELEDGTIIITGGTIKLRKEMIGDNFDEEMNNLERVQEYLETACIINRQGLLEN
jgi:DNA-directed RNA polymerase delta subunit